MAAKEILVRATNFSRSEEDSLSDLPRKVKGKVVVEGKVRVERRKLSHKAKNEKKNVKTSVPLDKCTSDKSDAPDSDTKREMLAKLVGLHDQPKRKRPTVKNVFEREEAAAAYRKAVAADGGDLFDDPLYGNALDDIEDDVECVNNVESVLRGIETPSRCGTPVCLNQNAFYHGTTSISPLTPFSQTETIRSTAKERKERVRYHLQRQAEMKSLDQPAGKSNAGSGKKAKVLPKTKKLDVMLEQLTQKTLPKNVQIIPKFNPMNDSFNSDNEEKMNACLNDLSDSWS